MRFQRRVKTCDGKEYDVSGPLFTRNVDDSFSHVFGVHHESHEEICDFDVESICIVGVEDSREIRWADIPERTREEISEDILQMRV